MTASSSSITSTYIAQGERDPDFDRLVTACREETVLKCKAALEHLFKGKININALDERGETLLDNFYFDLFLDYDVSSESIRNTKRNQKELIPFLKAHGATRANGSTNIYSDSWIQPSKTDGKSQNTTTQASLGKK